MSLAHSFALAFDLSLGGLGSQSTTAAQEAAEEAMIFDPNYVPTVQSWIDFTDVGLVDLTMSAVSSTGSSPPVATLTGTPIVGMNLQINAQGAGASTINIQFSTDGGTTFSGNISVSDDGVPVALTDPNSSATVGVNGATGILVAFASGTFSANNVWTANTKVSAGIDRTGLGNPAAAGATTATYYTATNGAVFTRANSNSLTLANIASLVTGSNVSFAVACRYYQADVTNVQDLLCFGHSSTNGQASIRLRAAAGTVLQYRSKLSAGTVDTVSLAGTQTVGWHWVILVVVGTTAYIYSDQGNTSGSITAGAMSVDTTVLGALDSAGTLSSYFDGYIRQLAFFQNLAAHRPLSGSALAGEIQRLGTFLAAA